MHLSWNEVRVRAAKFAKEDIGHQYKCGDGQLADNRRRFFYPYWKGLLLIEQKTAGIALRGRNGKQP